MKHRLEAAWKVVLTALCAVLLSCAMLGYSLYNNNSANAATGSSSAIGALYNFDDYCYDQSALDALARAILGGTSDFDDLIDAGEKAGTTGTPLKNKELSVSLGRYRASVNSSYKSLTWLPVYLSRSTSSGDAILTLYLAETATSNTSTSSQELSTFSYSSTYCTEPGCSAPTNSYGTSYLRTVILGNGAGEYNRYAYYSTDHSKLQSLYPATTPTSNNVYKFSDFITTVDGVAGALTEDIVTPSEIAWQKNESAIDYIQNESYNKYSWPNEAYGKPTSINYTHPAYFDYSTDDTEYAKDKDYYDCWQYDKLWLPSLTEVGTGDIDGFGVGVQDGIWQLTKYQRNNNVASWLRTACTQVGSAYNTYTMYATAADGNITTLDCSSRTQYGVRPAIHLDLNKIAGKTTAPVNLPNQVTATYNGSEHVISVSKTTVDADQLAGWWKADGSMIVSFYEDEECQKGTVPLYAGTYYMAVELLSQDLIFKGESSSVRWKATKFVVQKIQLHVTWTYDEVNNNTPTSVTYDRSQLLERDIIEGNVPELGMKYSNVLGVGILNSVEFPDEKGTYRATAYIKLSDVYNYNYEIASEDADSRQFTVKEKNIDEPYFLEAGVGVKTLSLPYSGKQYVQIANISSYVSIIVKAAGTSADLTTSAEENIEDLGVSNGIQTFRLSTVATYTFTIKLIDPNNTQWASSTDDYKDTDDRVLSLAISRAQITVSFEGLPASWDSNTEMSFTLNVLGIYDNSEEDMRVYYITSSGSNIPITKNVATGKYTIPKGLNVGTYTLVALMTSQVNSNYYMESAKTQKFTISQATASFGSAKANWIYVVGNSTSTNSAGGYDAHNTPSTALEVENTGDYYKFALSISETRLTADNLKATYSGDTYVKEAGLYSVTVVISAYNKNVIFQDETYTIYFRINKKQYNLSSVKWDYSTPFVYSGNEYSVVIDPSTLPAGLTATYVTSGDGISAGSYVTAVSFIVSDDNYETPTSSNTTNFAFTCSWEIVAQEIVVDWNTANVTSNILFTPTLVNGDKYVDYTFEHYENGSWVPSNKVSAETVTEKYRVTATIKSIYLGNYVLMENGAQVTSTSQEFDVESGKQAVSLGFTINNVACDDNEQFAYTGNSFIVKPVTNTNSVTISSFSVEYFKTTAGVKGASLGTTAPVNVGTYCAVASVTFDGGYLAEGSDTEIYFEIVKADMDITGLRWTYTYESTIGTTIVANTISAYWDVTQQKWIDDDGKEVVFAIEYDGTEHKLILEGENTVPELYVSSISGNTNTNAGSYTASVQYTWSDNYNAPAFPFDLSWEITKATVNLENVKWGYIDADGGEHEFDFENDAFVFTRDENGEVAYTVGLINLPSYISVYFNYKTTNLTLANSSEQNGNSFSAVGSYLTKFTFSGEFSDANHNLFNSSSIPSSLSTFIQWEIADRELTKPSYDGSWVIYDGKVHDLALLCNIPEEELYYFDIDITYVDPNNNIVKHYDGTNYVYAGVTYDFGSKYAAKNAGTYLINFYRIMEIEGEETDIFWPPSIEITVGMEELTVVWDNQGSYPVARVKGVAVSDIIGTRYTSMTGTEIPITSILNTDGVTFYAQPYVTEAYECNIRIKMADNAPEKLEFTSYHFTINESSQKLEYPELAHTELEYTGEKLTFEISSWYGYYENYLYISDANDYDSNKGELYATDIGTYTVVLNFIKDANAYWSGTDGNRSSCILTFKVINPSKMAVGYPELNTSSQIYDGTAKEFIITNWMVLDEYLEYEVFYKGVSQGTNLHQTAAGIYTIKFNFKTDSIGYWKNDPDDPKKEYILQFEIKDPNAAVDTLMNPSFTAKETTVEATGNDITFTIDNWSYYSQYIDISCDNEKVTISATDGTAKASAVGSYTILLTAKAGSGVTFENGETSYFLTFKITPSSDPNVRTEVDKPKLVSSSASYTGAAIEFKIADWDSIYKLLIDISCDDAGVTISEDGTITATAIGVYTLKISLKLSANAVWTGGGTEDFTLKFSITASNVNGLEVPELTFNEREFTGKEIEFTIKNWDSIKDYVTLIANGSTVDISYLSQIYAGTYTVTVRLTDPSKATWTGGNDVPLTFTIKPANLTAEIEVGSDGKVIVKNGDDEQVYLDEYLDYEYWYIDENGEKVVVPEDELEEGQEYFVNVSVKDDKYEDFYKNVENASDLITNNFNGTTYYSFKYEKPAGGISTSLIVIIVSVSVVVLLFIILMIVIAIKKRNAAYYEYDEYDDYDDYEDDDYDDDYYDEY